MTRNLKIRSRDSKKNTSNESKVIRRNIVENSILTNKLNQIEKQKVYYWKNLMDSTTDIKNSLVLTRLSTGSIFTSSKSYNNEKLSDMLKSNDKNIESLAKMYKSLSIDIREASQDNQKYLKSTEANNKFRIDTKCKTSISFDALKNNYQHTKLIKTHPILSYGRKKTIELDDNLFENFQKYIDTSKKQKISRAMSSNLTKGLMKTVKPQHKVFIETGKTKKINSSLVDFKEKNIVEWNKFTSHNIKQNKDLVSSLSSSDFTFQDKELYKIYVDLCSNRDAIIPLDDTKIQYLKKSDPVFSKRYNTWFLSATLNKAPKFEIKDNQISRFIPKYAIEKTKKDIISRNSAKNDLRTSYKIQVNNALARSKEFLDTISSFY